MVGKTFGRLTVVEQVPAPAGVTGREAWYRCTCQCGGGITTRGTSLRQGITQSCGCLRREVTQARNQAQAAQRHDLTGQRFHRLVVEGVLPQRQGGQRVWLCRCDCGRQHQATTGGLRSGGVKSCGCLPTRVPDDLTGQRFGRLTVLALTEARGSNGGAVWQCQCDCGAQCQVPAGNLRQGRTVSCGCVRREDLTGQRAAAGRGWHSLAVPVSVRSGEIDPPGRPGGGQNPELWLHHRPRQRENRPDAYPRGHCLCSGIHPWGFARALPLRLCGVPPGEAGLPHCVRRGSPYRLQRPGLGYGSPVSPHPGQRWAEKCLLCPEGHPPAAHSPHPVCPAVATGFGVGNESLPPLTAGPWRGCAGTTAGTGRQWQGRSSRRDGARPPPFPSGHGGGGGRGTGPGTGRPTAGASRWW